MTSRKDNKLASESLRREALRILKNDLEQINDVVAIFDTELNYILVNKAACELLLKQRHELEGENFLQLFPQLTASASHRHLLNALSGETLIDAVSEGSITKGGAKFLTNYYPLKDGERVYAVIAQTRKIYFP